MIHATTVVTIILTASETYPTRIWEYLVLHKSKLVPRRLFVDTTQVIDSFLNLA
jgi:uncharacterized membrane protein